MLIGQFDLKCIPSVKTEIQVGRGYIDHRRERCCTPVEAYFHGAKADGNLFVVGLIWLHGTHGAKPGIAASLRKASER